MKQTNKKEKQNKINLKEAIHGKKYFFKLELMGSSDIYLISKLCHMIQVIIMIEKRGGTQL